MNTCVSCILVCNFTKVSSSKGMPLWEQMIAAISEGDDSKSRKRRARRNGTWMDSLTRRSHEKSLISHSLPLNTTNDCQELMQQRLSSGRQLLDDMRHTVVWFIWVPAFFQAYSKSCSFFHNFGQHLIRKKWALANNRFPHFDDGWSRNQRSLFVIWSEIQECIQTLRLLLTYKVSWWGRKNSWNFLHSTHLGILNSCRLHLLPGKKTSNYRRRGLGQNRWKVPNASSVTFGWAT